jgi:hypothetical protein
LIVLIKVSKIASHLFYICSFLRSNLASGSTVTEEEFLEFGDEIIDSENIDDTGTASVNIGDNYFDDGGLNIHTAFFDARRRLELRIAERKLEKDIREFDFDP